MQERYARFHARFPLDDVYLGLARGLRNDAYLYLLALSGHRRADEADENVPLAVATAIAQAMGVNAEKMLTALEGIVTAEGHPRILQRQDGVVRLLKHNKWQDTPEQIAELKKARSEAGVRGAEARWGKPHIKDARGSEPVASAMAPVMASGKASAMANGWQADSKPMAETEREKETESLNTPPLPPLRQPDVSNEPDEAMVEMARGMSELLGRVLSGRELIECQLALNQYAYLGARDLVARAQEHQDWCKDNGHPLKRTVGGFAESWQRHNDHQSDIGAGKAQRIATGRTGGMTALGDLLRPREAAS